MLVHLDDLFSQLEHAEPSQVDTLLAGARDAMDADDALAFSLMRANIMTQMAGSLFVYDIEVEDHRRKLTIDDDETFLRLPFDEAIQHFLSRGIVSFAEFQDLTEAQRKRAFAVKDTALQSVLEQVKAQLDDAMRPGGTGLREFVRSWRDQGVSPAYLENVYRTNTATSYSAGRLQAMQDPAVLEVLEYWQYVTVGDDRVRDSHARLDGKVWEANSEEALSHYPPNGYQCFPAGTLVQGDVLLGNRAAFSGQLLEFITESGRRLSVTPNHPLLTPSGFASANSLNEGDYVLADMGDVQGDSVVAVNPEDNPARIEELFNSLLIRNGSCSAGVVGNDFHGDALCFDGDIDIVGTDRELLNRLQSDSAQGVRDTVLVLALSRLVAKVGNGDSSQRFGALLGSSGRGPGRTALTFNRGRIFFDGRPLETLRVGATPGLDSSLYEPADNDGPADAELARKLLHRNPGMVAPDKIVHINRYPFHDYVYDLQTTSGTIIANGIYTSNCRCSIVTRTAEDIDPAGLEIEVPSDSITDGFGGDPTTRIAAEAA